MFLVPTKLEMLFELEVSLDPDDHPGVHLKFL